MGDEGNRGTAADRCDGRQVCRRNSIALQGISNGIEEFRQGPGDELFQFRSGDAYVRVEPGKRDSRGHRSLGGQSLLGQSAFLTQPSQGTDCRSTRRVGIAVLPDVGQDFGQQGLIDLVARELREPNGLADWRQAGVGHGDAAAAGAEVAQCDHSLSGKAGVDGEGGECGRRIGHQHGGNASRRHRTRITQRAAECADRTGSPMRGHRHRHLGGGRPAVHTGERLHGLGGQGLTPVRGPVRGNQWHRIADPFHESAQNRPPGVGCAHFRRTVLPQRQYGTPTDRCLTGASTHQVGRSDRYPERLGQFHTSLHLRQIGLFVCQNGPNSR